MRLWSRLRARSRSRTPICITRVHIVYLGAFPVHVERATTALTIDLAWSAKSETILTEDGAVWSHREMTGPAIDRLIVDPHTDAAQLLGVGDLVIGYPVALGVQRGTVSATAPGVVRELSAPLRH